MDSAMRLQATWRSSGSGTHLFATSRDLFRNLIAWWLTSGIV